MITANTLGAGNPDKRLYGLAGVSYIDTANGNKYSQITNPSGKDWILIESNVFFYPSDYVTLDHFNTVISEIETDITILDSSTTGFQTTVEFGLSLFPSSLTVTITDTEVVSTSVITCSMTISSARDTDELEFTGFQCTPINIIDGVSFDVLINDTEWGATGQYILNAIRKK